MFLGIDTSNYTTSVALFDDKTGKIAQSKKLLPVKEGELGLRQSDAVFSHVKQLGDMVSAVFEEYDGKILAVGASTHPRDTEGSYMPCFLVGEMAASCIGASCKIPVLRFAHQQGHVAAALYSANRLDLLKERFIAFHLSGGTTEALLVEPDDNRIIRCTKIGGASYL